MQPKTVTLVEVGPRDGLQNESNFIQTEDKIAFINLLSASGLQSIEVSSFVSPKLIPQLQDATEVLQGIQRVPNTEYLALVPNLTGLKTAMNANLKTIAIFTAASEQFNQHNIHCSIQESIERFKPVIEHAKPHQIRVRAYISCALGCPYEGAVEPKQVLKVAQALLALGVDEISLADTIGVGTPKQTQALLHLFQTDFPVVPLAMHFHDTYGQALANILTSLELGIHRFDCSVAGLGGCPYAPGATGNVATEDVLYFMHGLGIETGVDIFKLIQAGVFICKKLGRRNQSKVANAMLATFPPQT